MAVDILFNVRELPKKIFRNGQEYLITFVEKFGRDTPYILSYDSELNGSDSFDKKGYLYSWEGAKTRKDTLVEFSGVPDYMVNDKTKFRTKLHFKRLFHFSPAIITDRMHALNSARIKARKYDDQYQAVTCVYTGRQIPKKLAIETIDGYALRTLEFVECAYSGGLFHETSHNCFLTQEGVVHNKYKDYYSECLCCGVYSTNGNLCPDCRNTHFICNECGEPHKETEMFGNGYVCLNCASEMNYIICEECGDAVMGYKEYTVCPNCARSSIRSYSEKIPERDYGNRRMFGVEMEVCFHSYGSPFDDAACVDEKPYVAHALKNEFDKYMMIKADSSIDNGFEIVTKPLEFHDSLSVCGEIMDSASRRGCKEDESCGVHIHVSKAALSRRARANIIFMFSEWEEDIVQFSRREYEKIERWAKIAKVDKSDSRDENYVVSFAYNYGRYTAINLIPDNTIEFRVFSSTVDSTVIRAYILFVNAICDFASTNEIEKVEKTSFMDVFRPLVNNTMYSDLIKYMKSLGFKF